MILINASSYINAEFEAELGKIPPCMLPIGNKKLLQLQVEVLSCQFPEEKIIVSLPDAYVPTINEQAVLDKLPITVQWIPESLSLAEAILYVLNLDIDQSFRHVRVIQGDVLLTDLPTVSDAIGITSTPRFYDWQERKKNRENPTDWIGYFAFASRLELIKALAVSKKSFVRAVQRYQQVKPMQELHINRWYDCGDFVSYIHARANMTTERAFNSLIIQDGVVTKTSENNQKIEAEIYWFTHIPPVLRRFTPQLLEFSRLADNTFYQLEFLPFMPLNELYVHGRNTNEFWQHIFGLLKDYFATARQAGEQQAVVTAEFGQGAADSYQSTQDYARAYAADLYHKKTLSRLINYAAMGGVELDEPVRYEGVELGSVRQIAEQCIEKALALPAVFGVMHGDLCFSNMMYDTRGRRIKVFDPRGTDSSGKFSTFGNLGYDLAKLAHSVIGMYDFIIAGRYELVEYKQGIKIQFDIDERLELIRQQFLATEFVAGLTTECIMPAVVLLFLSMLPLHQDRPDRQRAMLINAFSLYKHYVMESQVCS